MRRVIRWLERARYAALGVPLILTIIGSAMPRHII